MHYQRWLKHGSTDAYPPSLSPAERLAQRCLVTESGCIEWTGATARGYGELKIRGAVVLTHRLAWELTHGPIPPGMFVCHKCDNPPCCNPDHLFLGTPKDNTTDMVNKGRHVSHEALKVCCSRGHEFAGENLYTYPDGRRGCHTCMNASSHRYYWKKKANTSS